MDQEIIILGYGWLAGYEAIDHGDIIAATGNRIQDPGTFTNSPCLTQLHL